MSRPFLLFTVPVLRLAAPLDAAGLPVEPSHGRQMSSGLFSG
jgi:hypothetical protein